MRRLSMRLRDERGVALVFALATMSVLSICTVAVITYSSASQRQAGISNADQSARALAEAGINNAMSILSNPNADANSPTLLTPSAAQRTRCGDGVNWCFWQQLSGGWAEWFGTYDGSQNRWTITAFGIARNPSGPSAEPRAARLVAQSQLVPSLTQRLNAVAWNYMLAGKTSNATTCDMTMSNSAMIDSPLYVAGNLCLEQSAKIYEPGAPVNLIVRGKLAVSGQQAKVGDSAAAPITEAQIGGGCTTNISQAGVTCVPNTHRVWARRLLSTATPIQIPVGDWAGWYNAANPGPKHACNPVSALPAFDNDTTLNLATNGSLASQDLTPAYSYTCVGKDPYTGARVGELSWNNTTKTLTVAGAIYIDGSVYVSNGAANLYDGHATLYLTGTFSLTGGTTRLCASRSGTNCDFSWDPNKKLLIIIPNGNDGSGNSVIFGNGVMFQGGFFAKNAVDLGQSSTSMGPMMGSTIKLSQSAQVKPLPLIDTLPLGAPGNPNTTAKAQAPTYVG
jgi:hypothetical protein